MELLRFLETASLAAANSYRPIELRYDAAAEGSWFMVCQESGRTLRVLWHGPLQVLTIELAATAGGPRRRAMDWEEVWRAVPGEVISPENLLAQLDSALPRA